MTQYLCQVGQGHMCLWCNEKGKRFTAASDVQKHMLDKGHCKLIHDGESLIEYDEWYADAEMESRVNYNNSFFLKGMTTVPAIPKEKGPRSLMLKLTCKFLMTLASSSFYLVGPRLGTDPC